MKPRRFLSNSFNKNYFPVATLSLAIFLVLIYAWMQPQDNTNRNNAVSFYFNQGLDKIEFPLYIKFLRKYMENEIYYRSVNDIENEKISKIELYWMLSADPFFQSCLNNNACLEPNSLMHLKWQDKRIEYQKIINAISFQRFGFKPADPTCLTAFTSLFFQETSFQLWLNIIFILIIGVLIEAKIGKLFFLLGYMISGMMMLSSSCWIVPYSIIPISGSSGGVAGLMGIMLALFCIQRWGDRLQVNENDLISLPMLCILPCWILLQLILLQLTEFDMVDFICQSAGFFFGILLMFYLYGMHCLNSCGKKKLVKHLNLETGLAEAYNEISLFNHTKAKKILYGLLEEYPTSKEIYFQLFNIVKLNPVSEEYHHIAEKILSFKDPSKATIIVMNYVFKHYTRKAQPSIRFEFEVFIGLLKSFRKYGYNDEAIQILKVLTKYDLHGKFSEILAHEQLLLARHYLLKNDKLHADRLLSTLIEAFPHTESAIQAKNRLENVSLR